MNQEIIRQTPLWAENWPIAYSVVQAIVILLVVVLVAALMSFIEIAADMLKIMFKEDWTPKFADKLTFRLAPAVAMATAVLSFMVIPVSPTLGVADMSIGLLFFMAMAGIAVYAVLFGGWASNNKYALLGGLRSAAQTISYEVFLGISLMGVVAIAGSFNMREIVEAQRDVWFVIPQFLGFLIFIVAGVAVTHRHPFDQPEAEQELAEGYHVEYGGMKWGMFFVAEYVNVVLISALIVTLFFGGWLAPFNLEIPFIPPVFWFIIKTAFFVMMFVLARGSLMRPRYDQVMNFGWKICLPLALVNLLVTGAVILMNQA